MNAATALRCPACGATGENYGRCPGCNGPALACDRLEKGDCDDTDRCRAYGCRYRDAVLYRTIVADPPWDYGRDAERWVPTDGDQSDRRAIPYASMTTDEIAALPIADFVAPAARLFLWTTNRHLRDGLRVMRAWGFRYRQTIVWHKLGAAPWGGSVAPISAEFLLVGTKGDPPVLSRWPTSVVAVARGAHSQKPEVFLDLAEQTSPGPYLELFARRDRLGWATFGNESLGTVAA